MRESIYKVYFKILSNLYKSNLTYMHKRANLFTKDWFIQGASATFILLFVYTATSKLLDHSRFLAVLGSSPLLGKFAPLLSYGLPVAEYLVSLLLFFPLTRKSGLQTSLWLMILFTAYIIYMLLFTPHLPCSCGGVLQHLGWKGHLVFNLFFTGLAFLALNHTQIFIAINRRSRKPVNRVGKQYES
jgi:hypothetical protein